MPSEIIVNEYFAMSGINLDTVNTKLGIAMSTLDNWYFNEETCKKKLLEHFHMEMLDGLGLKRLYSWNNSFGCTPDLSI